MTAPAEILADLENTARPECDSIDCHTPATHIARIHFADHCDVDGLDPDGNAVWLLCIHCLATTAALLAGDVAANNAALPVGANLACNTCARPLASVHDVLEVQPLR